jgi:hypothetical protein
MIGTQSASEIHPPRGPAIDVDYVRSFAQAHEHAGFDRILIGYFSNGADGFIVAQYAAFVLHAPTRANIPTSPYSSRRFRENGTREIGEGKRA